jgi:DNA-binding NarL/FixJ family response regulator
MFRKSVPRLLIADDHRLMAEACAKMLQGEFNVVGIVTDGRALVQTALELKPDGAIIDVSMPLLNGLDAAEQIKRKLPAIKLMFLTVNSDPDVVAEAFRRGASGYILKFSGTDEFMGAVRTVMAGTSYLSPLITRETLSHMLKSPKDTRQEKRITRRQSEVLHLLAEGCAMKDIASILDISPGTVAFHKYNMMEKLGITTNAALFMYAMKHRMVGTEFRTGIGDGEAPILSFS